jgi:hypothetical protein
MVVLNRPMFHWVRPLDEELKVRWTGRPFFSFRSSCLTRESAEAPSGLAPWVCWSALAKTSCSARLHCAEWSCVVWIDSLASTLDRAEIGRISRLSVQRSGTGCSVESIFRVARHSTMIHKCEQALRLGCGERRWEEKLPA